ncbi:hypothetical protein KBY58_06785 [Cyanobium sp. HWJ4-Hawea]|uniref:hypothetical protein n=1 Tax=Cyanobium sp. HWJ4-Hawea TaxID=2823713 RepID=UPI0020CC96F7|nr:hypothetical protein [Cyanobium sp. HWJ4-Hawea]MCP9809136.1 hypothetical protein [Cyanobium sp. HWJ4-Hawea]
MRLHLAIAHYYNADGGGQHGSLSANPLPRLTALRRVILQLHRLFGGPSGSLNHLQRCVDPVTDGTTDLKITICVVAEANLLHELNDLQEAGAFTARLCQPKTPKHLGFECHHVLEEFHKDYDYSGYLEDDIIITDADFFLKLRQFNRCFGNNYLLQPNRIETSQDLANLRRFYIDGDYNPAASEKYRDSMDLKLCMEHLGEPICFGQPLNTHSGCFFLNNAQAQMYFKAPHWSEEDESFHSPLESAATLAPMKTFQIMKPSLNNGRFLTVEHAGRNFMGLLRSARAI